MPFATLVKGMRTFDTVENRGYVLVSPGSAWPVSASPAAD
jgi:hypothetical protein